MIKLSVNHEKFAQEIAKGVSASDAYRIVYPKSLKWKNESVWPKASHILAKDTVQARIQEIKAELSAKYLWTKEQSVKALIGVINDPDKKSDIIAAVKELNAMHGFYEETKQNASMKITVEHVKESL